MKYHRVKYFDQIKASYKFMTRLLPSVQGDALIYCKDFEIRKKIGLLKQKLGSNLAALLKIFVWEFYFYLLLSFYPKYYFIAPTPSAVQMFLFSLSVKLGSRERRRRNQE